MRVQNVFTVAKLMALFIVIVLGLAELFAGFVFQISLLTGGQRKVIFTFYFNLSGKTENLTFTPYSEDAPLNIGKLSLAFYSGR